MSRQTSSIKSGLDKGREIVFSLLEGIEDAGGNEEDARRLKRDPHLKAQVGKLIMLHKDMMTRQVTVDWHHTPEDLLRTTGCEQNLTEGDIESIPLAAKRPIMPEEIELWLFRIGREVKDPEEIFREYKLRGLKPAPFHAVVQLNIDDPFLACRHNTKTYWRDAQGGLFCVRFDVWSSSTSKLLDGKARVDRVMIQSFNDPVVIKENRYNYWCETDWLVGVPDDLVRIA